MIPSLKIVGLLFYSGAKITVFSYVMEQAVSFLGRVAMKLYQLLCVDNSEVVKQKLVGNSKELSYF